VAYVQVTPRNFLDEPSERIKVEFETRRGCQANLCGRAKFLLPILQVDGKVCYRVDEGDSFDFWCLIHEHLYIFKGKVLTCSLLFGIGSVGPKFFEIQRLQLVLILHKQLLVVLFLFT
jgi:hypothetical protein